MKKIWRIIELLTWGEKFFNEKNIEQPRLNMEFLLGHVLNMKRLELYLQFEKILSETELSLLHEAVKRRASGEPLIYILGETDFFGCKIKVTPSVLIPRPETELMVEQVAKDISAKNFKSAVDLGTGSGCIAISLARKFPELTFKAIDISEPALALARTNAEMNGISSLEFIHQEMISFLNTSQTFDLIISNPPYISKEEYQDLSPSVRNFEPMTALTDETDGKKYIKEIIQKLPSLLSSEGFAYIEFGYQMGEWIREITASYGLKATLFTDLHQLDRFVRISK